MLLDSLTKSAIKHTLHCLLGCSIGEILGMAISTNLKWSNFGNIVLSILLAFLFGYGLTYQSVYRKTRQAGEAAKTAIATDTASIISMESVDNIFILLVPGAINANLNTSLFWISLLSSLVIAFVLTVPVNRLMITRGGQHSHHH